MGEKVYLAHTSRLQSIISGRSRQHELEAGIYNRSQEQRSEFSMHADVQVPFSTLKQFRSLSLGNDVPIVGEFLQVN